LEKALQRYGVTHKLSTAYHPQSNGQTEVTNRAIKRILERSVGYNPKDWSEKLNDALWAFRMAYKTLTGCTPFRLVYGKPFHLPVEIEHKAHWASKQCNMDLTLASKSRLMRLNELAELRDGAYENTRIYKERTNKWHDSRLRGDKDFKVGDQVLLYNSRLKMYPGKLKSKWSVPNIIKTVYPHRAIEITNRGGFSFKVNGQRLKKFYEGNINKEDDEVIEFENGDGELERTWPSFYKNPRGVLVGPKTGFKSQKEYRLVTKKPNASSSINKKKGAEPTIEVSNSNPFDVLNSVDNDREFGTNRGTNNLVNNEATSSGFSFMNIDNDEEHASNTPIGAKIDKIE
ncbi:reverse transcriptase domain-containing protein, partial [Tanacetum coccineum]